MNKTFKTIWNDVRRNYMVVNETQKSHGKPAKSAVALAVVATALFASAAGAAYVDPGFVAQNSSQVEQAKTSWETAEYLKNWGLVAQHASAAYALGYYGQGVKIGQMDSGILQGHQELTGDRWHVVSASGQYTHDGERYPQYAYRQSLHDGRNRLLSCRNPRLRMAVRRSVLLPDNRAHAAVRSRSRRQHHCLETFRSMIKF